MALIQIYTNRQSIAVFADIAAARGPRVKEFPLDGYIPLGRLRIPIVSILPLVEVKRANHGRARAAVTEANLGEPEKRLPVREPIHIERRIDIGGSRHHIGFPTETRNREYAPSSAEHSLVITKRPPSDANAWIKIFPVGFAQPFGIMRLTGSQHWSARERGVG